MAERKRTTDQGGSADTARAAAEARYDAGLERLGALPATAVSGYALREGADGKRLLQVLGQGFTPGTVIFLGGARLRTKQIDANTLEAEVSARAARAAGPYAEVSVTGAATGLTVPLAFGPVSRPAITGVALSPELPKHGEPFDVAVSFRAPRRERVAALRLEAEFPNGERREGVFTVGADEQRAGRTTIAGLVAGIWGPLRFTLTAYATGGGAATRAFRAEVVPSNPFQVAVYPQYAALSWKGAAKYDSATGRYYCYARCVFSNGHDYAVTIRRPVRTRVTDGGSEVTSFSFDLDTSYTVAPHSSLTLYLYTYYRNSDTADIFENFGDVRIELKFATSIGDVAGSAVWVMMGHVNVACNFAGDFSGAERSSVRNIVLGAASAIYEQVDLSITSAPILEIPQSNGDWSRYRVIKIDSCKSGADSDEADDLRDDWSSPSTYPRHVDLWFVESFSGASCASSLGGFSPRPGPASKSGDDSGVVIDIKDLDPVNSTWGRDVLRIVVAHELGHYLGLPHVDDSSNLMAKSTGGSNTGLTWSQHNTMDDHDWVQRRNP